MSDRIRFPHYTEEERRALEEFMKAGILHGVWSFEVRLKSRISEFAKELPENWRRMWETVTAKRIDAVCEEPDRINIIEVKRRLMSSGIGQLITYEKMYKEQFKPTKPIQLWMVAWENDPDVAKVCADMGIKTWTVVV